MAPRLRIGLAALCAGAAVLGAGVVAAQAASPAHDPSASVTSSWRRAGTYATESDCENAGLRGQNQRWWNSYRCSLEGVPATPPRPRSWELWVK